MRFQSEETVGSGHPEHPTMLANHNSVIGIESRSPTLTKLDGYTNMSDADIQKFSHEFFHKEPCVYSHVVYQHAAVVFEALKHDLEEEEDKHTRKRADNVVIPNIEFESENDKRLTYQLVFSTLKYQKFLSDMLNDCGFFVMYSERFNNTRKISKFKDDYSLVMVMLCDFKQRYFQRRTPLPGEIPVPSLVDIEDCLYKCKTKLNAALARSRIKARVLSIDHLLPESVRKAAKIGSQMHLYGWVNTMKSNMSNVLEQLRSEKFTFVSSEEKLSGKTFMRDHHCPDLICFPSDQRDYIESHPLVLDNTLFIQDKSSSVGVHSARQLINVGDDILVLNVGSGLMAAHLASLTENSDSVIYCFGIHDDKQHKQIQANLDRVAAKSRVKLFQERFEDTDIHDERFKHIKVVLMNAECSRSGVANPVNFIVSEGEDMSILRDLSRGFTDDRKLGQLVVKHSGQLKHALRFPRVQAVVYCTRSLLDAENEGVVTRAIEYVNMVQQKKTPFRIAPPVLPLTDKDIEHENPLNGKYLRYPPSSFMSGCFVAVITREADDPKEAAKDILARAAARGIISGVPVETTEKKKKGSRKKDKGRRKRSPPHSPRRSKSSKEPDLVGGNRLYSTLSMSTPPHQRSLTSTPRMVFAQATSHGHPQVSGRNNPVPRGVKLVQHLKPFR